jgi:fatty-acyl-CoA synthase
MQTSGTFQPETLPDVLRHHANVRPSAVALQFEGQNTSYQALAAQANGLAQHLHAMGVQAGERVAYLGFNHPKQIALLFATAQLGAICVPLNYRLAAQEWDGVVADCAPRWLFSDAHWAQPARDLALRAGLAHSLIDQAWAEDHDPHVAAAARLGITSATLLGASTNPSSHPHTPALLVYTSGTTGRPKGAVHTQANLLANIALAQQAMELSATDTVATVLPLFHVGGLCIQTLPALYAGAKVILHARFDAAATLQCIAQDRPTLTLQVPATMRALVEHPQWQSTDLSCLRAVWAGSSVLPAHWVQAFQKRGAVVCNVYGSTETGPFSIALGAAHAPLHPGSCGWPAHAPGLQVQVRLEVQLDASGNPAPDGIGELCISAPNVAQCYWPNRPLLDDEGYFHTGDLARCAPDGSYTVVGRAKDMLISGGENIYPAEIENLLAGHPLVAECAVIGLPDAQWGEKVVACVVLRAPGDIGPSGEPKCASLATSDWVSVLNTFLTQKIARYKLPKDWVLLTELPKTAMGKVQKDRLLTSARARLPPCK